MLEKVPQLRSPIQTFFFSNFNLASSIVVTNAMVYKCQPFKMLIGLHAFLRHTKLCTMCKALKRGSNIITIMLWTCHAPKDFKKSKKSLITFIISSRTVVCRSRIAISKKSNFFYGLKSCNNLISMFTINVIVFVNASNNNQCP